MTLTTYLELALVIFAGIVLVVMLLVASSFVINQLQSKWMLNNAWGATESIPGPTIFIMTMRRVLAVAALTSLVAAALLTATSGHALTFMIFLVML